MRPNHLVTHLLETANFLAENAPRTNLGKALRRRAISTAYYAVFQALCYVLVDVIVGWAAGSDVIEPVFRSLGHRVAVSGLRSANDPDLQAIGALVARLQKKRLDADYLPPGYNPSAEEAIDVIRQAQQADELIHRLNPGQRRRLVAAFVTKGR